MNIRTGRHARPPLLWFAFEVQTREVLSKRKIFVQAPREIGSTGASPWKWITSLETTLGEDKSPCTLLSSQHHYGQEGLAFLEKFCSELAIQCRFIFATSLLRLKDPQRFSNHEKDDRNQAHEISKLSELLLTLSSRTSEYPKLLANQAVLMVMRSLTASIIVSVLIVLTMMTLITASTPHNPDHHE